MSKNPFPGMNPFLEEYWWDVHASLVVGLRDALQPLLPKGLCATMREDFYVHDDDAELSHRVRESRVTGLGWRESAEKGTAVLIEPEIYHVSEFANRRRIDIIDVAPGEIPITAIEVLTPRNKGELRDDYLEKSERLRRAGVNLFEIDLLRQGEHALAIPLEFIPAWRHGWKFST